MTETPEKSKQKRRVSNSTWIVGRSKCESPQNTNICFGFSLIRIYIATMEEEVTESSNGNAFMPFCRQLSLFIYCSAYNSLTDGRSEHYEVDVWATKLDNLAHCARINRMSMGFKRIICTFFVFVASMTELEDFGLVQVNSYTISKTNRIKHSLTRVEYEFYSVMCRLSALRLYEIPRCVKFFKFFLHDLYQIS